MAVTWPINGAIYTIRPSFSGKCLTVNRNSYSDGAAINQYQCLGRANQRWRMLKPNGGVGAPVDYYFQAVSTGKCMTVSRGSTNRGARIVQMPCQFTSHQRFRIHNGLWSSQVSIPLHAQLTDGRCLDIQGASQANNAALLQWGCNGRANQKFSFFRS
ncbi:RICIN domain-containing protein [Luteipulveratus halotolerans]|uniref:RICIN domain-containing protein n=1 Tax=Luteipulveratus halotolerans TaxID=1631356 RepID=UPI0008FBCADC